jgi:methionine sulfoxide reductase catalytic subunit
VLIKTNRGISSSEITDAKLFLERRRLIRIAIGSAIGTLGAGLAAHAAPGAPKAFEKVRKSDYSLQEEPTDYDYITQYNNFYEFGTSKEAPAVLSQGLKTRPWSVVIEGEVEKPGVYDLEEIILSQVLEERIYRLRCVEAWSMVVPWVGFPLGQWLKQFNPTSRAKFVEFVTLFDPDQMPGQRRAVLDWPYVEGLRIDEAMHPLTIMVVGLYGKLLPNQNGAPLRLVVPWKYGFKSIKSIVKIRLIEQMPKTAWNKSAPNEYGFFANVNPNVDHPRWSQKRERVIGSGLFTPKRDTELFNGYAEQVAHLYAGMDLRKFY